MSKNINLTPASDVKKGFIGPEERQIIEDAGYKKSKFGDKHPIIKTIFEILIFIGYLLLQALIRN